MKFLIFISTIPSTLLLFSSHPISMMVVIILQTLILCVILWLSMSLSWFSYILFLIFLGGIMVLFIYISSLASNEKFYFFFNQSITQMFLILSLILMSMIMLNKQLMKFNKTEFSEMIFKIYSENLMNITMFTIFYLIFTLIVVVKMTAMLKGPLRSKY